MNHRRFRKGAIALAGLLILGLSGAAIVAQEQDKKTAAEEGNIIRILPEGAERAAERARRLLTLPGDAEQRARQRLATPYYIGLAAVPVPPAVRAHVDLPSGAGLMVEHVFEGSPAEKAGVRQYDLLLQADENELRELQDLVAVVDAHGGEEATPLKLVVIRRGERSELEITPAKRPEGDPQATLEALPRGNNLQERHAGPLRFFGGLMPEGFNAEQVPGGVSISITRQNDGPPRITVKRGEETWEVVGDDPESLAALPEDLRPMVERMLETPQRGGGFHPAFPGEGMFEQLPPEIEERFRNMEEQMRQLQRELFDQREAEESR